ncbi:polysaccharide biosynthesis protein [Propionibacteriaceae bacterium Y1700]|uniref:polysaccharide biosynthesis protein n=1 Tax=Microlunatus sp. Y1700 TaxID=3418487 RepID=UPI003DA73A59
MVAARYDLTLTKVQWSSVITYALIAAAIQIILGFAVRIYLGRFRVGSFDEAARIAALVAVTGLVTGAIAMLTMDSFPRGLAVMVPPMVLVLMAAGRWAYRAVFHHPQGVVTEEAERALIYGAGDAAAQLLVQLRQAPTPPYRAVGLIDDARAKRHRQIAGVRVIGTRGTMFSEAERLDATVIILAIPQADSDFVRDLTDEVESAGLKLVVVPPIADLIGGRVQLSQLHEVKVEDLLGRRAVETDLSEIAGYLSGRRVLVTGAGGSIGSEIARQLHRFGPSKLIMLDRDESALHGVQLSIYGQGLLDTDDMVLCDIRDLDALDKIFARHEPEVVFHAAALKHLPMLEQYPDEGWKTNVVGTLNVLTCAQNHGVQRFVNISTDKAADPSSVLGRTKRTAEQLTAWFAAQYEASFISVRFGNVLGSRGSMLHTFRSQIERGGPVTVTHPDVTRYFMTIPEACQLTLQAAAIGMSGGVLVLDMGTPISILSVAERLIAQSGKKIEVVFTGLRPGEKMHEVLFSDHEQGTRSAHELIRQVSVPPVSPHEVEPNAESIATYTSKS